MKLGLTVKELEVYMTRERKILKGPRKGEFKAQASRCQAQAGESRASGVAAAAWPSAWRGVARRGVAWYGVDRQTDRLTDR